MQFETSVYVFRPSYVLCRNFCSNHFSLIKACKTVYVLKTISFSSSNFFKNILTASPEPQITAFYTSYLLLKLDQTLYRDDLHEYRLNPNDDTFLSSFHQLLFR